MVTLNKDGRPRKQQIIPDLIYINNEDTIQEYHLDELVGQASIVFSLFKATNGQLFNTREISERLEKHPEYKTKRKPVFKGKILEKTPAMQIVLFYLRGLQQLGLVKYADPIEEEKSLLRRTSSNNPFILNSYGVPKGRYKHVRVNGRFAPRGNQ